VISKQFLIVNRRRLIILLGCLIALFALVKALTWNDPVNRLRRALSNVHENELAFWYILQGDYSQEIKGILPEDFHFAELLANFDRLHEIEGEAPGWIASWSGDEKSWWDPPSIFDELHYRGIGGSFEILGRSGKSVYYRYISW